jgi:ABC-type polar amino acid transport system ATPase subunit
MKPAISISNISKSFGTLKVLKDITIEVAASQVVAIIGTSGSGKTTLLRCINRMTNVDAGTIMVDEINVSTLADDKSIRSLREKVGMVFQQYNLWPHKTVLENIIQAPQLVKKLPPDQTIRKARTLLNQVGLSAKENNYPDTLSGGQQQRVAIARALAMEPDILLLDEITSALDPELVGEVLNVVIKIVQDHKRTIILVTHEMAFARDVADRVLFLDGGRIIEEGKPAEIFNNPKEERTKQFLKRILRYRY